MAHVTSLIIILMLLGIYHRSQNGHVFSCIYYVISFSELYMNRKKILVSSVAMLIIAISLGRHQSSYPLAETKMLQHPTAKNSFSYTVWLQMGA